jgi:L-fuculose-phosphate aldolase
MADPTDDRPMRGRAAEYEAVLGLLASTGECQGKVLLVEGHLGTGKSLLLATAGREAPGDFHLAVAAANELSHATPLAPLLGAPHATTTAAPSARTVEARPGTQAVLLGDHGVLAVGPDTETAVSLLVALEEAAEAELRAVALG